MSPRRRSGSRIQHYQDVDVLLSSCYRQRNSTPHRLFRDLIAGNKLAASIGAHFGRSGPDCRLHIFRFLILTIHICS